MSDLNFEKAKEKYENIKASDKLKLEVNDMFKEKISISKIVTSAVAAVTVTFTIALNVSSVFASTIASNKFMKPLVTILTGNKYEVKYNNMEANIVTPVIRGISDKEIEDKINAEIEEMSKQLIADFERDSNDLKEFDENAHLGIESNYIVKTDNDEVLSIDIYVVNIVGSSSTIHKFYNINKLTGEVIILKDKFENDDNYLEAISKYIEKEMERQNNESEYELYSVTYDELYKLVSEKQSFYINKNGNVVIVFDKYEVGPGSIGCPEFEIKK